MFQAAVLKEVVLNITAKSTKSDTLVAFYDSVDQTDVKVISTITVSKINEIYQNVVFLR